MFISETLIHLLWRTNPSRRCVPSSPRPPVCAPFLPIPFNRSPSAFAMSSWAFQPCGQPSHERSVTWVTLSTTRVFGASSSRVFYEVLQFALPQPPLQFPDEVVVNPRFLRLSCCAHFNTRRLWYANGTVHAFLPFNRHSLPFPLFSSATPRVPSKQGKATRPCSRMSLSSSTDVVCPSGTL